MDSQTKILEETVQQVVPPASRDTSTSQPSPQQQLVQYPGLSQQRVVRSGATQDMLHVDVPFTLYKQTARVQEVELPVEVTRVHVNKVEVQAAHEAPLIHPREVAVHQHIKRNNPTPVDVFSVQKYQLPRLQPKYYDIEIPIYVPRYIEVPVPSHFFSTNREPFPDIVSLGGPITSGLPFAPILTDKQIYSLAQAQDDATDATQKLREFRWTLQKSPLAHLPQKEECFPEEQCFLPVNESTSQRAVAADFCNKGGAIRPAFIFTPSHMLDKRGNRIGKLAAGDITFTQQGKASTLVERCASQINGREEKERNAMSALSSVQSIRSSRAGYTGRTDGNCSPSIQPAETGRSVPLQHSVDDFTGFMAPFTKEQPAVAAIVA